MYTSAMGFDAESVGPHKTTHNGNTLRPFSVTGRQRNAKGGVIVGWALILIADPCEGLAYNRPAPTSSDLEAQGAKCDINKIVCRWYIYDG